ncbi:immunity 52 family protein [Archangium violaceum]|uniref:Imm52 family immunity protein n=1 Tax=Archangium violaceum TaxID=83451 RepID=UPI001950C0DA|nr:Imm52 family immunity protein [Archangium violaceum]QRN97577.1 immunity 52 family protein [Archangium violaceum]
MTERYYAGVYWPARLESAEECARRSVTFFRLLSQCDEIYARWYEQGDSMEDALQREFTPDYATFLRFFHREENQLGRDGFSLGAWTGHAEDGRGGMVSLTCGDASGAYPNCCLLYLPRTEVEPEGPRVVAAPVLVNVLRAMVLAWEPLLGVIATDEFRHALRPRRDPRGFSGWLMYLSRTRGEVPPLPPPVRVEPVEDKGTLIVLGPERLSASNPEHLSLGRKVQEVLDSKELLRPVLS